METPAISNQDTKSIIIKYDKCTVFKKNIHQNLILIIICQTKGLNISILYDISDEIEENFESISKAVDDINQNE